MFDIIVATDQNNGIGKDNSLPWQLKSDLKYFFKMTTQVNNPAYQNAIIMGRNTYNSLPVKPLSKRLNIVLSRQNLNLANGEVAFNSFDEALNYVEKLDYIENTWVIGGGVLYATALQHHKLRYVYHTKIMADYNCDTFLPDLSNFVKNDLHESEIQEENNLKFQYTRYSLNLSPELTLAK